MPADISPAQRETAINYISQKISSMGANYDGTKIRASAQRIEQQAHERSSSGTEYMQIIRAKLDEIQKHIQNQRSKSPQLPPNPSLPSSANLPTSAYSGSSGGHHSAPVLTRDSHFSVSAGVAGNSGAIDRVWEVLGRFKTEYSTSVDEIKHMMVKKLETANPAEKQRYVEKINHVSNLFNTINAVRVDRNQLPPVANLGDLERLEGELSKIKAQIDNYWKQHGRPVVNSNPNPTPGDPQSFRGSLSSSRPSSVKLEAFSDPAIIFSPAPNTPAVAPTPLNLRSPQSPSGVSEPYKGDPRGVIYSLSSSDSSIDRLCKVIKHVHDEKLHDRLKVMANDLDDISYSYGNTWEKL